MHDNLYPVYITEVNCRQIRCFSYTLPPQNAGWENISLYVEYFPAEIHESSTGYQVWAQVYGAVFRAFLCSGEIPCSVVDPGVKRRIIDHINENEYFHEQLTSFISCICMDVPAYEAGSNCLCW